MSKTKSNLSVLVKILKTIENDFRTMRLQHEKSQHLCDNIHAKAVQAARVLFKAIDAGGLKGLWPPGMRQASHFEELSDGRVKLVDDPDAPLGKRPIPIPDDKLEPLQFRESWTLAIATLGFRYPEYFGHEYNTIDWKHNNEVWRVQQDRKPVTPTWEDEADTLNYYRCKAVAYADACLLLTGLLEANMLARDHGESKEGAPKHEEPAQKQKAGAPNPADSEAKAPDFPEYARNAMEQYEKACEAMSKTNPKPTDREAYDLWENTYEKAGKSSPLPAFSSWTSYLRLWRQATGQQKNKLRSNRPTTGHSTVRQDQV